MTSPARLSCSMMSSRILAHVGDARRRAGQDAARRLGVAEDGRERLVQLVGDGGRQLTDPGHGVDVRDLVEVPLRLAFDTLAGGHVLVRQHRATRRPAQRLDPDLAPMAADRVVPRELQHRLRHLIAQHGPDRGRELRARFGSERRRIEEAGAAQALDDGVAGGRGGFPRGVGRDHPARRIEDGDVARDRGEHRAAEIGVLEGLASCLEAGPRLGEPVRELEAALDSDLPTSSVARCVRSA